MHSGRPFLLLCGLGKPVLARVDMVEPVVCMTTTPLDLSIG